MRALEQLPAQVQAWAAASLGKGAPAARFTQLPGGANNLVFGCETPARKVVVKAYPQAADLSTDRFQAEASFLTYANRAAPGYVPAVIETDTARRLLVMENLEGARFAPDAAIERADVARAASFLARLNDDPALAAANVTLPAAEGFLELTGHAENVRQRVGELTTDHLPQPFQQPAQILIAETNGHWEQVQANLTRQLAEGAAIDALPMEQRCVSPSDFGFHNALRGPDGIKFYDFEFAGWDDPAKTLADFFLQPRIPVPGKFHGLLLPPLARNISPSDLARRVDALRPILRLKWVTIVLAVLRPARFQAMLAVAVDKDVSTLIEERFARARRLLSQGTI